MVRPHRPRLSVCIAAALLVVVVPLRLARVAAHRRVALKEPWRVSLRVATAVLPTLVFTIVLAEILQERFGLPPALFGALIMFAVVNTLIPGFAMQMPPVEFDTPQAPRASAPDSQPRPAS